MSPSQVIIDTSLETHVCTISPIPLPAYMHPAPGSPWWVPLVQGYHRGKMLDIPLCRASGALWGVQRRGGQRGTRTRGYGVFLLREGGECQWTQLLYKKGGCHGQPLGNQVADASEEYNKMDTESAVLNPQTQAFGHSCQGSWYK